jgi:hypothetical protein
MDFEDFTNRMLTLVNTPASPDEANGAGGDPDEPATAGVTQRMSYEEFERRLSDFVRSFDETWTDQDISRGYDAIIQAAILTGWTQEELWDESGRRYWAEIDRFIAEME